MDGGGNLETNSYLKCSQMGQNGRKADTGIKDDLETTKRAPPPVLSARMVQ